MSEDANESTGIVCIGVCIVDPESGICMGCGRGPEVVSWGSEKERERNKSSAPLSAAQYPLPPQVAREAENPSD